MKPATSPIPTGFIWLTPIGSLPKNRRKAIIGKLKLEARAKNTITDPEELLVHLEEIQRSEVSVDNQELYNDVIAIAVPIKDHQGRFYSSLAIQAPTTRVSVNDRDKYVPLLREAADGLARLTEEQD